MTELLKPRRLGTVLLATLASQGLSAAALATSPLLGLDVSDTYALGVQLGNASLAGIVIGIVYLLAIGRPWFTAWKRWTIVSAGFSLLLPLVVIAVNVRTRDLSNSQFDLLVLVLAGFGIGGAALSAAGVVAVRQACLGKPFALAALTVTPNLALLVGIVVVGTLTDDRAFLATPVALWALACFAVLGVVLWADGRMRQPSVTEPAGHERRNEGVHTAALAGGVVTSSVLPPLYITAVSELRDGAATVLFLVTKAGSSLVGLTVNSALLVRYNWTTERGVSGMSSANLNIAATFSAGAGLLAHTADVRVVSYVFVVVWWGLTLVSAPLVMREVNARRLAGHVLAKTMVDVAASLCVMLVLFAQPSFTGYLAAFASSQGITTGVSGIALKNPRLTASSCAVVAFALTFLFFGW
jgi:hypothetical protein